VVDHFALLEAPFSFTGTPKTMVFNLIKDNFKNFTKLYHQIILGLENYKDKWVRESVSRQQMRIAVQNLGINKGDIIIIADIDELPRPKIISLLKKCKGYPNPINLALRNYRYSFEFPTYDDTPNPNLSIWTWNLSNPNFQLHFPNHGICTDTLIWDGGWHCSWCYKYLEDFIWKMHSYSHNDRAWRNPSMDTVQSIVCDGASIWSPYVIDGAESFLDVFAKFRPAKSVKSYVDIPQYIVNNAEKYKHLLPGNCIRPSTRPDSNFLESEHH